MLFYYKLDWLVKIPVIYKGKFWNKLSSPVKIRGLKISIDYRKVYLRLSLMKPRCRFIMNSLQNLVTTSLSGLMIHVA